VELLLIRHAEPVRIALGEVEGPADPQLTERGAVQAQRLAAWLAVEGIDAIITSPLRRARETAEPLARNLELTPEVDPGVSEYDAGSGEYIPIEELRELKDHRWQAQIEGRWEDGTDPLRFQAEIVLAMDAIIERFPGGKVAVVCHGGVINVYLAHVLGIDRALWFHPAYTSVNRVHAARAGGPRSVASLNDTAHLVGTRDT
jgi:2,3-bisphosphoglycerate-dependent phosphoglycerate mutase